MKKIFGKNTGDEHNFWMSYTDLLSGFLIVFIIATIIYQHTSNQFYEFNSKLKAKGYTLVDAEKMLRDYIDKGNMVVINEEFTSVFEGIDSVKILPDKGVIRFYPVGEKEMFENGKDILRPNLEIRVKAVGKAFVEKAMELQRNGNDIEIRIEGHADSRPYYGKYKDPFVNNLLLSSQRAIAVYNCLMEDCGLEPEEKQFVKKNVIAVGYSSARPVTIDDLEACGEDKDKSRRIEFRIISK